MPEEKPYGWIGVDLDGTLAVYSGWKGLMHIGLPVPTMVQRVGKWLDQGFEVRVFTERASEPDAIKRTAAILRIQDWLEEQGLPRLEVTCVKDFHMIQLWSGRAVQVIENTGQAVLRQLDA